MSRLPATAHAGRSRSIFPFPGVPGAGRLLSPPSIGSSHEGCLFPWLQEVISDTDTLSQSEGGSLDLEDQLRVHPDWDDDIYPPLKGTVRDDIASFLKEIVKKTPPILRERNGWKTPPS